MIDEIHALRSGLMSQKSYGQSLASHPSKPASADKDSTKTTIEERGDEIRPTAPYNSQAAEAQT